MNDYKYTQEDFTILNNYKILSQSLGKYIGSNAEIALYSFENQQYSIINIVNGHISNKKIGDILSDRDENVLKDILDKQIDYKNNFTESVTGECSKLNYTLIKNSYDIPIGMLIINWGFDISLVNTLKIFIPESINDNNSQEKQNSKSEEIILDAIKKVITGIDKEEVGASVYNKTIIRKLFNQGIFEFKESVQLVSNYLNISLHTVYLHLRSIKSIKKPDK